MKPEVQLSSRHVAAAIDQLPCSHTYTYLLNMTCNNQYKMQNYINSNTENT